jgi:hypothetical protein
LEAPGELKRNHSSTRCLGQDQQGRAERLRAAALLRDRMTPSHDSSKG